MKPAIVILTDHRSSEQKKDRDFLALGLSDFGIEKKKEKLTVIKSVVIDNGPAQAAGSVDRLMDMIDFGEGA